MDDMFLAGYSVADINEIPFDSIKNIPIGPCMPQKSNYSSIANALEKCADTILIRQLLVENFTGTGYEVGAGNRPTSVSANSDVIYVDAFTFDEASDGSFIGVSNDSFVSVSIYDTVENLKDVPDASSEFFILCHVIEHIPNPIRAIRTLYSKLKPGGTLFLVVPWGAYTFDRSRPNTSLHHLVADYLVPSSDRNIEHYLEFSDLAKRDENWIEDAMESHKKSKDTHLHVFSPQSIEPVLDFCKSIDPWSNIKISCPAHLETLQEFYVHMTK
jgi:SAM-dependent methyltransferase